MKNLQIVVRILEALLPKERKVFKRFLRLFENDEASHSLAIQLYELIIKYGNSKEEVFFIQKLYENVNEKTSESFRKLLDRFRDKLYESMILDTNILNTSYYIDVVSSTLQVKKNNAVIYAILLRGVSINEKKRLLNQTISQCKEFELFDELVIFLKLYFDDVDYVLGYQKTKNRIDEIEFAIDCSKAVFKVRCLIAFFIQDVQHKSLDQKSFVIEIKNAVETAKMIYEQYKIKIILYNYYLLKAQYEHYIHDYLSAVNTLNEMTVLVLNTKCLFTRNRITVCYTNLSYTQNHLYRFEDSLKSMVSASKYYQNQKLEFQNYYKEAEVFSYIYLLNYEAANLLLNEIIETGLSMQAEFSSRSFYLHSIVKFLAGDYKKSFKLLQETREIENDKEGWNIGIRMLQIFLTLETGKVDLADQRIESLRKHIERTTKMKSVRKRDVVIFRLLNHLSRSGFNFQDVWEDRQKDFKLLQSDDPEYRWIPRSHELILFEQWFEAKVKGVPYHPKFPQPVAENKAD